MTRPFRRLTLLDQAAANDIVVLIARAGGTPKARLLLPKSLGIARSLEYVSLEEASNRGRTAAEKHDLPLAVVIDSGSGLTWQPGWDAWFGL
jgi:hypothetical protein